MLPETQMPDGTRRRWSECGIRSAEFGVRTGGNRRWIAIRTGGNRRGIAIRTEVNQHGIAIRT